MQNAISYLEHLTKEFGLIALYLAAIALAVKAALMLFYRVKEKYKNIDDKYSFLWGKEALKAADGPFQAAVWMMGISIALDVISNNTAWAVEKVDVARAVILIICISWFSISFVKGFGDRWGVRKKHFNSSIDNNTMNLIVKISQLLVVVLGVEISLETLGFNPKSLLAIGGIGGAALAFASQDLLSNFFGAIIIHLDKPFEVGDYIEIEGVSMQGTVDKIGWRMTSVIGKDTSTLYIPNSTFTKQAIRNISRMARFYMKETIHLEYESINLIRKIADDMLLMLKQNEKIATDEAPMVFLDKISASGASLVIAAYVKEMDSDEFRRIKQNILLQSYEIIAKRGAKLFHYSNTTSKSSSLR